MRNTSTSYSSNYNTHEDSYCTLKGPKQAIKSQKNRNVHSSSLMKFNRTEESKANNLNTINELPSNSSLTLIKQYLNASCVVKENQVRF